jgi:hypothetical protein
MAVVTSELNDVMAVLSAKVARVVLLDCGWSAVNIL